MVLRRTQESVAAELGLLGQYETARRLCFSGVESHMYQGLLRSSQEAFGKTKRRHMNTKKTKREGEIEEEDKSHSSADARRAATVAVAGLGEVLLTLRKACCHPRLAESKGAWRKVLTMSEVCLEMIAESRRTCEDKQRSYIYHLISSAGLLLLHADMAVRAGAVGSQMHAPDEGRFLGYSQRQLLYRAWETLDKAQRTYEGNRRGVPLAMVADVRHDASHDSMPLLGPCENVYCGRSLQLAWSTHDSLGAHMEAQLWEWPDATESHASLSVPHQLLSETQIPSQANGVPCPSLVAARIDFTQGQRVLEARVCLSVREYVASARHLLRRRDKDNFPSTDAMVPTDTTHAHHMASDSTVPSVLVLFPMRVVVQAILNADGFFTDITSLNIPNPMDASAAHSSVHLAVPDACFTDFGFSARSKSWRLRVDLCHAHGMLVPLDSSPPQRCPVPTTMSDSQHLEHPSLILMGIQLLGAGFDVDPFQEIHTKQKMCEVYTRLRDMGVEVAPPPEGVSFRPPRAPRTPPASPGVTGAYGDGEGYTSDNALESPVPTRRVIGSPEARNSTPQRDRKHAGTAAVVRQRNGNLSSELYEMTTTGEGGQRQALPPQAHYEALRARVEFLQEQEVLGAVARQRSARMRVQEQQQLVKKAELQGSGEGAEDEDDIMHVNDDEAAFSTSSREQNNSWWILLLRALAGVLVRDKEREAQRENLLRLGDQLMQELDRIIVANEQAYVGSLGGVHDVNGLSLVLGQYLDRLDSSRDQCISTLMRLPDTPSAAAVADTGDCQRCCAALFKTGPVCAHCRLQEDLER